MKKQLIYKIKRLQNGLLFCGLLVFMAACNTSYSVANRASHTKFSQKPVYKDTVSSGIYASANLYHNDGYGFNTVITKENNTFADFSIHRSHAHKHFKYSYGLFGYFGSYDVQVVEEHKGKKAFQGLGVQGDFKYNIPARKIDIHPVGVRVSALKEFGEFSDFRRTASQNQLIKNLNTNDQTLFLGVFTGLATKFDTFNTGFDFMVGRTFEKSEYSDGALFGGCNIYGQYKRFTAVLQFNFATFNMNTYSLGVQYQLF